MAERQDSVPHAAADGMNGATMAAVLAAGIGAFAMGLIVVLNEIGVFAAPALHGPAGAVSGRTTFAVVVWLIAWAILHARSKTRVVSRKAFTLSLVFTALGLLLTFPPVWGIL